MVCRNSCRNAASVFVLVVLSAVSIAKAVPIGQPNFVVIFIDDMGYGDIGPFGAHVNQTPHLDRMAREGMKLTSFYVAAPVCTPSRAALLTGCYPRRVGLAKGSGHAVLFPGDPHGLHPDEVTIAEILKQAGYATACFGKWHLGDQPEFLPTAQGFDEYFGIPYSNDMWPGLKRWQFPKLPVMRDSEVVDEVNDMSDQAALCRRFTNEAVTFIKSHRDDPFFVYLPHAFVHHPRAATQRFMKQATDVTEAQIEEVDWSVGQILQTLRDEQLDTKTLVIFTSDNGGARGCVNAPLRGGKGSAWEGGVREPTLAWWPGVVPAMAVCDEVVTAMDLLPTLTGLAQGKLPGDRKIDGKDILPLLKAEDNAKSPHQAIFYHQGETLRAVRRGPWKLFRSGSLYDLVDDIGETKDVAAEHPEIVQELHALMDALERDLRANSRPVGVTRNPRTLLPRPGVSGKDAYRPTLSLGRKK